MIKRWPRLEYSAFSISPRRIYVSGQSGGRGFCAGRRKGGGGLEQWTYVSASTCRGPTRQVRARRLRPTPTTAGDQS
ncbi:unnamed protein product, partial [Iphiclides podalirius]